MNISSCTAHITDSRQAKNQKYSLESLVLIVFSSVISGDDSPNSMLEFAQLKKTWLQKYVELHTIPCAETLRFFIACLEPSELIKGFQAFVHGATDDDFISIDGKTMRGTRNSIFEAIHVVSAWSSKHAITLAALESIDQSNEIKTIPKLLDIIDIKGATMTTDAMGCQRVIAQKIIDKKGDYALQVKGNQRTLNAEIQAFYHKNRREEFNAVKHEYFEEVTKGHGRIEQRIYHHVALTDWVKSTLKWAGAKTVIRVERKRITKEKESSEISWYLSSLDVDAKHAGHAVRRHWEVENQ